MGVAEETQVSGACWSCRALAAGAHFCAACGKIQPLARGTGYFAFFGLPQKLRLDPGDLEQRFLQLSWRLHPDNFVRASQYEQTLALERSAELNDAYRTLADPVARVEYLLGRYGARKEGETRQQAPPELLEEIFELNESLEQLRRARAASAGAELESLRARLEGAAKHFQEKLAEIDAELDTVSGEWDRAVEAGADLAAQQELFRRMNEILNRRSYVRNLVRNVAEVLGE